MMEPIRPGIAAASERENALFAESCWARRPMSMRWPRSWTVAGSRA